MSRAVGDTFTVGLVEAPSGAERMRDSLDAEERLQMFAALLSEHRRGLFAFIYSLLQHHADAEDAYQQMSLVLWEKFDEFKLGTNFWSWAAKVAHNISRDSIKSKRRRAPCLSEELLDSIAAAHDMYNAPAMADKSEALDRCLEMLSSRDRRLIERCYTRDRSLAAIAASEDRSVDAIYKAISRIRKRLFHCVKHRLAAES